MKIRIGIFDSGIGGFTVLQRLGERFGDISCIYLGDLARVPYGSKSPSEIRLIASELVHWLREKDLTAVLVACNTTNSIAMDIVERFSIAPVFGLIDAAAQMVNAKNIGILATPTTVASNAYSKKILELKPGVKVVEQSCPAFVPMIETGKISKVQIEEIATEYLKPLLKEGVEEIILGCSHYPLLLPILKELLPLDVRLIDPALGMVKNLDKLVVINNTPCGKLLNFSNTRFFVTADPIGFADRANHWLKISPEVELISLRSKASVF